MTSQLHSFRATLFAALLLSSWSFADDGASSFQSRGAVHFKAGRIQESIADFDRYIELRPDQEPFHWQRGISYYYAGEYQKGVKQFESHKKVNPQDVENGIWHYLCKAKLEGTDSARAALIDIRSDRRPWAMKVYAMYQGKTTPEEALKHAEAVSRTHEERQYNHFYTHFYIGLLHDAAGRHEESLKQIHIATEQYPSSHYMGDVARVHLQLAERKKE